MEFEGEERVRDVWSSLLPDCHGRRAAEILRVETSCDRPTSSHVGAFVSRGSERGLSPKEEELYGTGGHTPGCKVLIENGVCRRD